MTQPVAPTPFRPDAECTTNGHAAASTPTIAHSVASALLAHDDIAADRQLMLRSPHLLCVLDAIEDWALVLNTQRQIVGANRSALEALGVTSDEPLIGRRPGEAMGCVHADEEPGGCGAAPACATCGAFRTVLQCLASRKRVTGEACISLRSVARGGTINARISAAPLPIGARQLVLVILRDIAPEVTRDLLGHAFLHDVVDGASSIRCLSDVLASDCDDPATAASFAREIGVLADTLIGRTRAAELVLAAGTGRVRVRPSGLRLTELQSALPDRYTSSAFAQGKRFVAGVDGDRELYTDVSLVLMVLDDLIANAFEATPSGGEVRVGLAVSGETVELTVTNPGVVPPEARRNLFTSGCTTKGRLGRGFGTCRARVLVEGYLGGRLTYRSDEWHGTVFTASIAASLPPDP